MKRAQKAMAGTQYTESTHPVIAALVAFAAQNSGGRRAYREECRSITADWRRFKLALETASADGVTDKEVIDASKTAFSGRLEWISKDYLRQNHNLNTDYTPQWDYTPGQYFPNEYRKAAATVIEEATRGIRRSRPAQKERVSTISQLKALNEKNGGCWFGRGEMRFFGTRIESGILQGRYFITSEQPPHGPRKFSVRSFNDEGSVDTVGDFCAYGTKSEALASIPKQ